MTQFGSPLLNANSVIIEGRADSMSDHSTLVDTKINVTDGHLVGNLLKVYHTEGEVETEYYRKIRDNVGGFIFFDSLYAGTPAIAVWGDIEGAQITVSTDSVGTEWNDYTLTVQHALLNSVLTSATLDGTNIDVIVGTAADGVAANADIGSGGDGTVTVTYFEVGEIGNEYSIEVVLGSEPSQPLSVEFNSPVITVNLATTEESVPDVTATTAAQIAALINELELFTATASGTGLTPVPVQVETSLAGGINPTVSGTAADVAVAISLLDDFTATMTGAGGVLVETVDPVAFEGGTDTLDISEGDRYQVLYNPVTSGTLTRAYFDGNAAVAISLSADYDYQVEEIRIHLSTAGGAGNLTVTVDHSEGAAYDFVLATQDMTAITDYVYHPEYPFKMTAADVLNIAWANVNSRNYGIEILYSVM